MIFTNTVFNMTHEELQQHMHGMSDRKLLEDCHIELDKLCKTGAKSFTMTVPARPTDTDLLFAELLRRFEERVILKTETP